MDYCFKNCNKIEILKQSKKLFPTHITLFVKLFEDNLIDKKNREFKKLIPRNWKYKEEEIWYIHYEEEKITSGFKGIFSTPIITPKCKKMFLHFIYKKIEGSNTKDLLAELNKIYNYLKNNESSIGCSYGYTEKLRFSLMFGFDLDINNLEKELIGSININPKIFVRTSELKITPEPEKKIDRFVMKPFQIRVENYREYEFYVTHKIGRVYEGIWVQ
jgi:hypothetical protein